MSKTNPSIANLVALGSKTEENEKKIQTKEESKEDIQGISSLTIEVKKNECSILIPEEIKDKYQSFFEKKDYGVGESTIKIPLLIHKQIKLLSAHTGVPFQQITSNILNQFLTQYEEYIKKSMKL